MNMDDEWLQTYFMVSDLGEEVAPRGIKVKELICHTISIDMNYPVLRNPARRSNYRFMAAEAAWILRGSDKVDELTPYNARMSEYSDNGVTLAGAYGPRIQSQLGYVLAKLLEDKDTRQATLTIWTPNPGPTKDYPCTIAMDFKIRQDKLYTNVFMRSSDVWLGLPYDVFVFSMVSLELLLAYHDWTKTKDLQLGDLFVTAASSHLYEGSWGKSRELGDGQPDDVPPPLPIDVVRVWGTQAWLMSIADSRKGDAVRWWETTT